MRVRGVASPHEADALSMTYYASVKLRRGAMVNGQRVQAYATPAASPFAPRGDQRRTAYAAGGIRRGGTIRSGRYTR